MEPTVVFDLGEVLVASTGVLPQIAAALDVDEQTLAPAYWAGRRSYDLGGSATDYWTAVVAGAGRTPEADLLTRLEELDSVQWSVLPPESVELLAAVSGMRLAVLSNAPAPLAAAVRAASWTAPFAHLVFSAEVGLLKPDPAIYAHADTLLGRARVGGAGGRAGDPRALTLQEGHLHAARRHEGGLPAIPDVRCGATAVDTAGWVPTVPASEERPDVDPPPRRHPRPR